jgi:hypothetical protein
LQTGGKNTRITSKHLLVKPDRKGTRQEEKPKPKYTIKQMNDKAKELGMSYGHYSTLLAQGNVKAPDER